MSAGLVHGHSTEPQCLISIEIDVLSDNFLFGSKYQPMDIQSADLSVYITFTKFLLG